MAIAIIVVANIWGKGMIKIIPILLGVVGSYIVALIAGKVDFTEVSGANFVGLQHFVLAKFDLTAILVMINASLAAVNLTKAACKRLGIAYSISSCKSFIHNAYMLERFICVFGINPDMQVIDKFFKELILFTARAA